MLTKQKITDSLKQLPPEFTLDQLIDRLLLIEKIDQGDQESAQNRVLSEAELDEEIKGWSA